MKRCKNCVLPETFPGIKFNNEGICNFCLNFKGETDLQTKKHEYRQKFEELKKKYKGKQSYDALMSYSGGKDSTYVLSLLRESYGLNVLAVTFDNGFIPDQTLKNIRMVAEKLGFDHIFFKPRFDFLKKIFVESSIKNIYSAQTLTRASTICTSCISIVKFSSLRIAIEKAIPFVVFGWSPGQIPLKSSIMKNNPQIIKMMQKSVFEPLYKIAGNEIRPYFLEEQHFKDSNSFPYNISPLAFLDYNEENIIKKVSQFGWLAPTEVDAHSTNCLLNSFANIIHKTQHGYHPYVFELAKLVREGYMKRSVALSKLNDPDNQETIKFVKSKLGL